MIFFTLLHLVPSVERPSHFTMNLDAPPEKRWKGAIAAVLRQHSSEHGFGPVFAAHNQSMYNQITPAQWSRMGEAVKKNYPEHATELRSISAQFREAGYSVSFEYLVGWLYFHELAHTDLASTHDRKRFGAECTCILAQDDSG